MAEAKARAGSKTGAGKGKKTGANNHSEKTTASAGTAKKTGIKSHIGAYVNGTDRVALYTILLPDNTCGMFLMPSAQDVFWLGFTTYKVDGDKLFFKIQNPNPETYVGDTSAQQKTVAADEQYIEATLKIGKEYIQHDTDKETKYIFLTDDVNFWLEHNWKSIGEARLLDFNDMGDFDIAHEIKKLCLMILDRFGRVFIWS